MGFLPIIITLAGFIGLFFLVVNQSIISKKKAILNIQGELLKGLEKFGFDLKKESGLTHQNFQMIDQEYQKAKSELNPQNQKSFEVSIKPEYQLLKITVSQYNKLIKKRPYSFVAKSMGHKHLG